MADLTVKQRIAGVLMSNMETWLTVEEIAMLGYGDVFMKDTRKMLTDKVRRNVNGAMAELNGDDFIVLSEQRPKTEKKYKSDCALAKKKAISVEAKRNAVNRVSRMEPVKSYKIASPEDDGAVTRHLKGVESRVLFYIEKYGVEKDSLSLKKALPEEYKDKQLMLSWEGE